MNSRSFKAVSQAPRKNSSSASLCRIIKDRIRIGTASRSFSSNTTKKMPLRPYFKRLGPARRPRSREKSRIPKKLRLQLSTIAHVDHIYNIYTKSTSNENRETAYKHGCTYTTGFPLAKADNWDNQSGEVRTVQGPSKKTLTLKSRL